VVPGDVVILAQGDKIPADCRLFVMESNIFRIDQAILTGESESVEKYIRTVPDSKAVKQDQINMLFSVSPPDFVLIEGNYGYGGPWKGYCHRHGGIYCNRRYPYKHRLSDLRTDTPETETRRIRRFTSQSN